MNYARERVVATKGAKNVYSQNVGTSDHISLLCCVSAAGSPLAPMIIYSKSFPGGQYRFDGPDDTLYAKSDSRWIDSELFLTWLKKIFLICCPSTSSPFIDRWPQVSYNFRCYRSVSRK